MTHRQPSAATQVYSVYIKATPEQVWDAITKPEWTERYGFGGYTDYDLRPGATFTTYPSESMKSAAAEQGYPVPDVVADGEVVEADKPRRLVLKWRLVMDPELAEEGLTGLTYEIDETPGGTKLTVVHDLADRPKLGALVNGSLEHTGAGGGWAWILSDLKSLLETGKPLAG